MGMRMGMGMGLEILREDGEMERVRGKEKIVECIYMEKTLPARGGINLLRAPQGISLLFYLSSFTLSLHSLVVFLSFSCFTGILIIVVVVRVFVCVGGLPKPESRREMNLEVQFPPGLSNARRCETA